MVKLTSQDLSFYQIFSLIHFQNLMKLISMTFHYITVGYCQITHVTFHLRAQNSHCCQNLH